MSNNNDAFDMLTLPSIASCAIATSAMVLVLRTSYIMGTNSAARGTTNYTNAYWTLCSALLFISSAFAIVKVFE